MGTKDFFIMKPKVDFCFKELLSDEYVRRGFLSAILGRGAGYDSLDKIVANIFEKAA